MSITTTAVLWSSASTLSVTSATPVESDAIDLSAKTLGQPISFQVFADNAGTPAAGDTALWKVLWSNGDSQVDGSGDDDYDTFEHAEYLIAQDTVAANSPGEDPAGRTLLTAIAGAKCKLACMCAQAATRNVTISARYGL